MCASQSWSVEVDLESAISEAIGQIPAGRVATFGDVAKALGDVRAARAIGAMLAEDQGSMTNAHRVVFGDGGIGGHGRQAEENRRLLLVEGAPLANAGVDLERCRFADFRIDPVLRRLAEEQERMRALIVHEDEFASTDRVAGFDVAYRGEEAFGALVVFDLQRMERIEERVVRTKVRFPYIPGYLGYRETPVAHRLIGRDDGTIYLIDGQGELHPRGFGVACHIGVTLGVPTVGAAKSLLVGRLGAPEGTRAPITIEGKVSGMQLRPMKRTKVYVSVGHRVSLGTAADICERLMVRGVPEPQRQAHLLATETRRREGRG